MPFPALTLLDSLERPNENPLSNGGKWLGVTSGRAGEIKLESYTSAHSFGEGEDRAYWTPAQYTRPAVAVKLIPGISVSRRASLFACLTFENTTASGYWLAAAYEGGGNFSITLIRFAGATETTLQTTTEVAIAQNDLIGLATEPGLQAWVKHGAGVWETIAAEVADATYSHGYVGLGVKGAHEPRLKSFEAAGAAPSSPARSGLSNPTQKQGLSNPTQKGGNA